MLQAGNGKPAQEIPDFGRWQINQSFGGRAQTEAARPQTEEGHGARRSRARGCTYSAGERNVLRHSKRDNQPTSALGKGVEGLPQ